MSGGSRMCPARWQICPAKQDFTLRKSRSKTKMMNLEPDKLTTSKKGTIDHIEIRGTIRVNLFTRNHT
jgi:hypothetical protein